jgi:hypothetical protein
MVAGASWPASMLPSRERLRGAFDAACSDIGSLTELDGTALRHAVSEFAADARQAELPVERAIALLKHCVDESAFASRSEAAHATLTSRAIAWLLDAYYPA